MVIITRSQFEKDTSKYLSLAESQRVIIQSGDTELELGRKKRLISDEDIANAISGEQLKEKVIPQIRAMFK